MSDIFDYAVANVIHEEGGYVDDPNDTGGATNMGITISTLSKWRGVQCSKDDVKSLPKEEAEKIYKSWYWDKVHGDSLRPSIAILLFDASVNHGVTTAIKLAQRALRVLDDGILGSNTMKSLAGISEHDFIVDFMTERLAFYTCLQGWQHFGHGWTHRLFKFTVETAGFIKTN